MVFFGSIQRVSIGRGIRKEAINLMHSAPDLVCTAKRACLSGLSAEYLSLQSAGHGSH